MPCPICKCETAMTVCPNCGGNTNLARMSPAEVSMVNLYRENQHLRSVVRQCARVLQWHLGMLMRKDEKMMLGALNMAWDAVGRGFCEAPSDLPEASNTQLDRPDAAYHSETNETKGNT